MSVPRWWSDPSDDPDDCDPASIVKPLPRQLSLEPLMPNFRKGDLVMAGRYCFGRVAWYASATDAIADRWSVGAVSIQSGEEMTIMEVWVPDDSCQFPGIVYTCRRTSGQYVSVHEEDLILILCAALVDMLDSGSLA